MKELGFLIEEMIYRQERLSEE